MAVVYAVAKDPLVHRCNGVISQAPVNVLSTGTTCYASSAPISGFRLSPVFRISALPASTSGVRASIKRTSCRHQVLQAQFTPLIK
jgi:hypothetical protein